MKLQKNHWVGHAAKWQHVGSPLRPCPQDVAIFLDILKGRSAGKSALEKNRFLLLGVTPELALLNYPLNSHLIAVDNSLAMIGDVWPASMITNATVVCADWRQMPLPHDSIDLVLADGCFTLLSFPGGYNEVIKSLCLVLGREGYFAVRLFVRPDKSETVDEILGDLKNDQIASFHALKWRLAMSLHADNPGNGVRLGDIWDVWNNVIKNNIQNSSDQRWTHQTISTIDNYRGVETRYSFPSYDEISSLFGQYFCEVSRVHGTYELAECCPVVLFKVKNNTDFL